MNCFQTVLELIGVAAFALSGASAAARYGMDLLGILILGVVTATGGGIFRDLLLGLAPPTAFRNPLFMAAAAGVALLSFFVMRSGTARALESGTHASFPRLLSKVLVFSDAVGLGIFTAVGFETAYAAFPNAGGFLWVTMAVVTACGGGVFRDIFCGEIPLIFSRQIYATASIAGGLLSLLILSPAFPPALRTALCTALVIGIRLLALSRGWNLPRAEK